MECKLTSQSKPCDLTMHTLQSLPENNKKTEVEKKNSTINTFIPITISDEAPT